jgi:hypothetical protein
MLVLTVTALHTSDVVSAIERGVVGNTGDSRKCRDSQEVRRQKTKHCQSQLLLDSLGATGRRRIDKPESGFPSVPSNNSTFDVYFVILFIYH